MGATTDATNEGQKDERLIKLHPLAIVGISDHHTRVAVGGSHMATDAPVVGLLFGVQAGLEISILDAQEMEYSFSSATAAASGDNKFGGGSAAEQSEHKASLEIKIELHKKVFPTHEVVGWYRVHPISDATTDSMDVQTSATVRGFLHESCKNPLMLWMQPDADTNSQQELPIRIFESTVGSDAQQSKAATFVPMEFEVNTGEPERIAVEKAFSDQPASGSGADNGLDMQVQSLESCIQSMASRLETLLEFVEKCKTATMTPQLQRTLRQVDGILSQLPVFLSYHSKNQDASFDKSYDDALTISYLAALNKSTNVLRKYADKVKAVQENNNKQPVYNPMQSSSPSALISGSRMSSGSRF